MEVVSKNGNIYLKPENGALIQLTNFGSDSNPCFSHSGKQVAFVRDTPGILIETGSGEQNATELWLIDVETRKTELLAKGRASDDIRKALASFNGPCFSLDDKSVYFVSAAWATSSSVHRVELATKKVDFITDGNSVEVIKNGQYTGSLLIDRALIKYDKQGEIMGRGSYLWLFSIDGKPVKDIGESEGRAARKFLKDQSTEK